MTMKYTDLTITDYSHSQDEGCTMERFHVVAPGLDAWYLTYSTNNFSGSEWQNADRACIPEPDHRVTHVPDDVAVDIWSLADGEPMTLGAVADALVERFSQRYWAAWRARVQPYEEALAAELFPHVDHG